MTEQRKLAACLLMSAVGLALTVDIVRIAYVPKQPGGRWRVGKHVAARPVSSQGAAAAS